MMMIIIVETPRRENYVKMKTNLNIHKQKSSKKKTKKQTKKQTTTQSNKQASLPDREGDVGSGGGDGEEVVVGLTTKVFGVDGFQQVSAADCHHVHVHRQLNLPHAHL